MFEQCGINQPDSKTFNFHFQRQAVLTLNGEITFAKLVQVFEKLAKISEQMSAMPVIKHTLVTQPDFDREFDKLNMHQSDVAIDKTDARNKVQRVLTNLIGSRDFTNEFESAFARFGYETMNLAQLKQVARLAGKIKIIPAP